MEYFSMKNYCFMVHFSTEILKFDKQGEKTGWTYIKVSAKIAQQLKPGNKKSFRVKGKLDEYSIKTTALIPMGEGEFIIPLKAAIRKAIKKRKGDVLAVQIEVDDSPLSVSPDLLECLNDEPKAREYFYKLPGSHRNYYTNWIESAKTDITKAKRIAQAVSAFTKGMNYGEMMRAIKAEKDKLGV
jgi:hypothetical protein